MSQDPERDPQNQNWNFDRKLTVLWSPRYFQLFGSVVGPWGGYVELVWIISVCGIPGWFFLSKIRQNIGNPKTRMIPKGLITLPKTNILPLKICTFNRPPKKESQQGTPTIQFQGRFRRKGFREGPNAAHKVGEIGCIGCSKDRCLVALQDGGQPTHVF